MSHPTVGRRVRAILHRRLESEARPPAPVEGAGPLEVTALAVASGLAAGLAEVGMLTAQHAYDVSSSLGALQLNRHYPWMLPLAQAAIFLGVGLPIAVLARLRPSMARRVALFAFLALGLVSLLDNIPGLYGFAVLALAMGVAARASRWLAHRTAGLRRALRVGLPALAGAAGMLGLLAYDREVLAERRAVASLPPAAEGAPNVLLIVLDTVTAGHMSLHGYGRDTTPNLRRLAERGVVFDQARSPAPWTLPSHASLFTGRWPHELGVAADRRLDATHPTLAEFLASHGYATSGFVGNTYYCNSWFGLGRGFAHYEDYYEANLVVSPGVALRCSALGRRLTTLAGVAFNARPGIVNPLKDATRVNRDFLRWLDAHEGLPFFAFLNYIDAHDPYLTPQGFDRHFGLRPESAADHDLIRHWHERARKFEATPRERALVVNAYDDCLAALDEQVGRLFDELERRGDLDRTLVIVTSDHGESLGEHRLDGHGLSLYRPEVHVPLMIMGPGVPASGARVGRPASLRDVAATIVDRLGLASSPFPGVSLARFWEGGASPADAPEPVLSEVAVVTKISTNPARPPARRGPMASIILDDLVYLRDAAGREELYDLAADPGESRNLAAEPGRAEALRRHRDELDRLVPAEASPR